jgi:hypothetical protein
LTAAASGNHLVTSMTAGAWRRKGEAIATGVGASIA